MKAEDGQFSGAATPEDIKKLIVRLEAIVVAANDKKGK